MKLVYKYSIAGLLSCYLLTPYQAHASQNISTRLLNGEQPLYAACPFSSKGTDAKSGKNLWAPSGEQKSTKSAWANVGQKDSKSGCSSKKSCPLKR